MMIPVVVVDDEEADRYLAKRSLSKSGYFSEVMEVESGDKFLELFSDHHSLQTDSEYPLLVLMDVNMPGRNGFETIQEIQRQIAEGEAKENIFVMMFTSSNNPYDREQAEAMELVKGYVLKPLDANSVEQIHQIYKTYFETQKHD